MIRRAPTQYGMAFLLTETDKGDLTYFINHQLDVIEQSLTDLHKFLDEKSRELTTLGRSISALDINHRQLAIVQQALKSPSARFTIAEQKDLHGVSYLTARADLEGLASLGLLKKTNDGTKSIYVVAANLKERLGR